MKKTKEKGLGLKLILGGVILCLFCINFSACSDKDDAEQTVFDPWANKDIAKKEYGVEIMNEQPSQTYDAVILAVAHDQFKTVAVSELLEDQAVLYDVKGFFAKEQVDGRL